VTLETQTGGGRLGLQGNPAGAARLRRVVDRFNPHSRRRRHCGCSNRCRSPAGTRDQEHKYSKTYSLRNAKMSEGVTEIIWSGGQLPDAHYDEFVFVGAISDDLQEARRSISPSCKSVKKGVARWIEIPSGGSHLIMRVGLATSPRFEAFAETMRLRSKVIARTLKARERLLRSSFSGGA